MRPTLIIKDPKDIFVHCGADALHNAPVEEWQPTDSASHTTNGTAPGDTNYTQNQDRPLVQLPQTGHRLESQFADDLGSRMAKGGLFQMGGIPVLVNEAEDGMTAMEALSLRTWAETHITCYKVREDNSGRLISLHSTMGVETARTALASSQFMRQLPEIDKFNPCRLPVIRSSGDLELLPHGYDAEAKVFTATRRLIYRSMSHHEAIGVINELLSEFPFADDAGRSKAVAIAGMFSVFCRGMMPIGSIVPAFFYLANAEGAGKTTLAQVGIAPVFGRAEARSIAGDDSELKKELLATLIEGRQFLLLDNLKGHLSSPTLEAFVTSPTWEGRVLGGSKNFRGQNNITVYLTGNGCTVSPDLRRRSLFCELFMTEERAEERKFRRVLDIPAILHQRENILSALWSLVQVWNIAGRPKPSTGNASFPRWADVIAGIIEFHGWTNPVRPAQIEGAGDRDGDDMRNLVLAMPENERLNFGEIVELCATKGLFEGLVPESGQQDPKDKSRLGKLLGRYGGRVFQGKYRFIVEGKGHSRRYQSAAA